MAQQIESHRKISTRSALLIGLLIGLAATGAIYSISNALAQTNSTTTTSTTYIGNGTYPRYRGDHGGMCGCRTNGTVSFHAYSRAANVSITGYSITSSNQIKLNLQYTGTGTSPAVTIIVASQGLTGSVVQQAGWGTSTTETVNLVGSGSLSSTSSCIGVLIAPYTG